MAERLLERPCPKRGRLGDYCVKRIPDGAAWHSGKHSFEGGNKSPEPKPRPKP